MVAAVATVVMAGELAAGLLTEVSTSPRLPGRREGGRLSCLMGQAPLGLALTLTVPADTTTTMGGRTHTSEGALGGNHVPAKLLPGAEVAASSALWWKTR